MKKKLISIVLSVFMLTTTFTVNVFGNEVVAKIGDNEYTSISDAISQSNSGDVISIVKVGTYAIPSPIDGVTIDGAVAGGKESVIFDVTSGSGQLASTSGEVNFKNVTFNFGNNGYTGFQHPGAINFTNCNINGYFQSYGTMNFTDCVFTQTNDNYSMWCYAGDVTYTRCTFNEAKAALNLYNEGNNAKDAAGKVIPWVITVENCNFVYTGTGDNSYAGILLKTIVGNVSDERCKNMGYKLVLKGTNTASSNWKGTKESEYGQNPSTSKLVGSVDGLVWVQQDESEISSVIENGVQVWPTPLDPVAKIGDTTYVSLQNALDVVNDNETIVLLKDIDDAEGIKIEANKKCVIDFNNHTYTIKQAGASTDSSGVLIKNNAKIEFKDGIITLDSDNNSISTVIKNCGDMTLDNMKVIGIDVIDASGAERVVTNKCGIVSITNGTQIIAKSGKIALDSCKGDTFVIGAKVTINNANIAGDIEVDGGSLCFIDGKLLGKIVKANADGECIEVRGGLFSDIVDESLIVAGKTCVANEDSNTNLAYPYTIGEKANIDINTDAKQNDNEEPAISSKISQADNATAQEIAQAVKKSKVDLKPEAKSLANNPMIITESIVQKAKSQDVMNVLETTDSSDIKIVVEAKLVQEVVEVNKEESALKLFKVDIVPKYEVKAINTTNSKTFTLASSKTLNINREMYMRVYLPTDFGSVNDKVWIKHYLHDGSSKVYEATIQSDSDGKFIEFNNPDGFSVFELSLVELTPDPKPTPNPTPGYRAPKTGVE